MCACVHMYTYVRTYVCVYVCVCVRDRLCIHVCVCVCVMLCVCILYNHVVLFMYTLWAELTMRIVFKCLETEQKLHVHNYVYM